MGTTTAFVQHRRETNKADRRAHHGVGVVAAELNNQRPVLLLVDAVEALLTKLVYSVFVKIDTKYDGCIPHDQVLSTGGQVGRAKARVA